MLNHNTSHTYLTSIRPFNASLTQPTSTLLASRNKYCYRKLPPSTSRMKPTKIFTAAILAFAPIVSAGPAAYGVCQAGCAAVVTACYAAAGFTWGATLGASAPATIIACNTAFGTCQAACWLAAIAPTP
ncbi:hypothetical protein F5B17DRAFT_400959 [Nemania serpens]|nr:hypothetical protein F5B17DRAFT_400959 [Nemania serpens]